QQPQQIRCQRRKRRACYRALGVYDDVPSCGYLLLVAAHDLAHAPPDTIAHHRAAQRFLDAEAKTALRQFVRAKENGEVGTRSALSGEVHSIKFFATQQPPLARKRSPPGPGISRGQRVPCTTRG